MLNKVAILPEFEAWAFERLETEETDARKYEEDRRKKLQKTRADTQAQLKNLTGLRVRELIQDDEFLAERLALTDELTRLDQQMKQARNSRPGWKLAQKHALRFVASASKAYEKGTAEQRREIVAAIGLNRTLCDKKVALQSHKWLEILAEKYPKLEQKFSAVEPSKNGSTGVQNTTLNTLILSWWAVVEEVGKALQEAEHPSEKPSVPS